MSRILKLYYSGNSEDDNGGDAVGCDDENGDDGVGIDGDIGSDDNS